MPESEARKEYKKKWREEHKEHIKQQSKDYYETHKEHKQTYSKQYRQANQVEIQERESKLVACDRCGEYVRYNGLARHKRTKKCMNFTNKDYKPDSVYCPLCNAIVSDKCMLKHQTSDKCKKRAELNNNKTNDI